MPGLGYVSLNKLNTLKATFSFDESICGMLFDFGLYSDPFADHSVLENYFGNNEVRLVHNLEEAEEMGLDETFMNGVPYYHVKKFYDYIGRDSSLYLIFASCIHDGHPDFEIIQDIQQHANGNIFQLGIWTEQCIWNSGANSTYGFTNLLGELESQAEVLSGLVNKGYSHGLPLSIILNANTAKLDDADGKYNVDHKRIPDGMSLNFPKVSVVLGQNGTDEVHSMQKANNDCTPVGFLGLAMACLALASAEMNIGYVDQFDLNKNEDLLYPELGFGNIANDDYSPIQELNFIRRNVISLKGYILPVTYKSKETGVYFSNEQTLSERDYSSISLNRIAHKCRRIVRSVMFPYINGNIQINPATGALSQVAITQLSKEITDKLDAYMVNYQGQKQISYRSAVFDDTTRILETDELYVNCHLIPVSSNMQIDVKEGYALSE